MASVRSAVTPNLEDFESLQFLFWFMLEHGVQFPSEGSTIYQPPVGKVGILVEIYKVGFRLPISDFFDEVMR